MAALRTLFLRELRALLTAVMYFTRIPVPAWVGYSQEQLNRSARYFPAVGLIVGLWGALVFVGADLLFSRSVALLLSMAATLYLTGVFHEDGFADFCDGFAKTRDRRGTLLAMKESTLGAAGILGLVGMLALKYFALHESELIPALLPAGHALSRWFSVTLFYTQDYAREDDTGKSKPMARGISLLALLFAACTAVIPLVFFPLLETLGALAAMLLVRLWMGRLFLIRLGGFTGDCAGALQQACEVAFYLSFAIVVWA